MIVPKAYGAQAGQRARGQRVAMGIQARRTAFVSGLLIRR
jgi:hypothetical protein